MRILAALALFGVAAFCLFGFLASYEYSEAARRFPWQVGYGLLGLAALAGAAVLLLRKTR